MYDDSRWLTGIGGQTLELVSDRAVLVGLGRSVAGLPQGAGPALLDALRTGACAADALAAFGDRGAEIQALLGQVRGHFVGADGTGARLLLCRPEDWEAGNLGGLPVTAQWRLIDGAGSVGGVPAGALGFGLEGAGSAALSLGLGEALPSGVTVPTGQAALTLRVCGQVRGGAGIDFPIRLGRVGASGSGREAADLCCYFAVARDQVLADSLASVLAELPNPFDLDSVAEALAGGRLLAMELQGDGELSLAGRLSVGFAADLVAGAQADVGVQAKFHSSRRGRFRLLVRAGEGPGTVLLDLGRVRDDERGQGVAVGLTLGLTALVEQLRQPLLRGSDEAQALLERLGGFVPPSLYLKSRLPQVLKDRLGPGLGTDLGEALAAWVGGAPEAPPLDRLAERLATAIDIQAGLWQDDLGRVAQDVLDDLLGSWAGAAAGETARSRHAEQAGALKTLLGPAVQVLITELRSGLDAELGRLAAAPGPGPSAPDPSAAVARARSQLAGLQRNLARLVAALQRSGEVKLNAGWRWEERLGETTDLHQTLLFRPGAAGAGRPDPAGLYRQALTGSLDAACEAALAFGDADPGAPVRLLAGALKRVAGIDRSSGFGLTLLDLQLETATLLAAEVEIETDVAGNIRVLARSESQRRRQRLGEGETFRLVNVYELATARATRHMTLSLALCREDDDLSVAEVQEFFRALADPRIGLLSPAALGTAAEAIRAFAGAGGDRVGGDLRIWLELDDPAVRRLLQLPPGADSGPPGGAPALPDAGRVYRVAIEAMTAGLAVSGSGTTNNNLAHFIARRAKTRDLGRVLLDLRDADFRKNLEPPTTDEQDLVGDGQTFGLLTRIADRGRDLARALEEMRRIYLGDPRWRPEEYRSAQVRIDGLFAAWIAGELADRGLWAAFRDDAIRPYLLAFFKAMVGLAHADAGQAAASPLNASLVLRRGERIQEVALARATALPPSGAPGTEAGPAPPPRPAPDRMPLIGSSDITPQAPRIQSMVEYVFPLQRRPDLDFESGARNFGARRDGGKRKHAGCDLKVPPGTPVVAMADGKVSLGPYAFYEGTYALEVTHEGGRVVRYGEIAKQVAPGVFQGAKVSRGQVIAAVGRLDSGDSMLHLEMYAGGVDGPLSQAGTAFRRRRDLMDPTPILKSARLVGEVRDGLASALAQQQAPRPAAAPVPGRVALGAGIRLNLREHPSLEARTLATLGDGDALGVAQRVTGGAHPFGDRCSWMRVRLIAQPGQAQATEGYVIARFVALADPSRLEAEGDLPAPPKRGMVSNLRLTGTLTVREKPSPDAPALPQPLKPGEVIDVVKAQEEGGVYKWDRRDWVKIRHHGQDGYVAGYYIDLVEPPGVAVGQTSALISGAEPDPWRTALLSAPSSGASQATAVGLGGRVGMEASFALAEQDLAAVRDHADRFASAAGRSAIPAAMLAAVASRESGCGRLLDDGWGDRGNAFGIMQIDKRHHSIGVRDPYSVRHIEQGAAILNDNLNRLLRNFPSWDKGTLLKAAAAAYNFGVDDVRTKEGIDRGTTHDDYGSDVIARAQFYLKHPDLEIFRQ